MALEEEKKLRLLLIKKFTLVLSLTFGFFKDDLTNSNAGMDGERHRAGVGHFQDLFAVAAGMDKVGSDVDHEADSSQGASTLDPTTEVVGESESFNSNTLS